MKIKPKLSELSRDEKLIRGIRNAINYYYEDEEERQKMLDSTKEKSSVWIKLWENHQKLNDN